MRQLITFILCLHLVSVHAQERQAFYYIKDRQDSTVLAGSTVRKWPDGRIQVSDRSGRVALNVTIGDSVLVSRVGFKEIWHVVLLSDSIIYLDRNARALDDVVVTGTMKLTSRSASPVAVEVYQSAYFRKSPSPSIFESLQMVNGVRPQLNCSICNTGDIHINGMEGPYTLILIDGMPIVSSLSSVYGLAGIPNSMVERIEIVKGPASSLYGSEAVGGLINVITRNPSKAALFAGDFSQTSWKETNLDLSGKKAFGKKLIWLGGLNYYRFQDPIDKNEDGFTDMTQQHRISLFQKLQWVRPQQRSAGMALRYVYEDRWGGDIRWKPSFRGGDSLYAESIYTSRLEWIGHYQLPLAEKLLFSWSYTDHTQRSWYGVVPFNGRQRIGFGQLTWDKKIRKHDLLAGMAFRYNWYDDNTPATAKTDQILLPGIFIQDELKWGAQHQLLAGIRLDQHRDHGRIVTPRLAWKYMFPNKDQIRVNAGTGFRTVNIFTEDHAALTGARELIIKEALRPERSYNINLSYNRQFVLPKGWVQLESALWYTHFTNRIIPDYTTNVNQIIYANLKGYSVSKGASLNMEWVLGERVKGHTGFTLQDVSIVDHENGHRSISRQLLTESYSATWTFSYQWKKTGLTIDYSGNAYGPMDLPLVSELDPRPARSSLWTVQHLQGTYKMKNGLEIYGGIKNLFDWTPARKIPFLIARAHDPFDKKVVWDANGQPVSNVENPYALSFDPNYIYASNQGRRFFLGIRFTVREAVRSGN